MYRSVKIIVVADVFITELQYGILCSDCVYVSTLGLGKYTFNKLLNETITVSNEVVIQENQFGLQTDNEKFVRS